MIPVRITEMRIVRNVSVESVDRILKDLLDKYSQPEAVELREETSEDRERAGPLAELGR